MKSILYPLLLLFICCQCESMANEDQSNLNSKNDNLEVLNEQAAFQPIDTLFDRTTIINRLQKKIENKEPLVVHAYIPLCDNINQGIVPTSASLGDGMSLKTNLYWATSGGTKAYFKKQGDWLLISDSLDIDTNVLERVVFKKTYKNTLVYFVADAYRGDRMEECINDYLASISVNKFDTIALSQNQQVLAGGHADLIMFNGHNGMMDYIQLKNWVNKTDKRTDVVMNSCVSYGYLQEEFMIAGGYPLVRTKSLLYPGAYVLEQIIDDWVANVEGNQLCLNAGRVYCAKHDCGAGTKVFKSGW